MKILCVGNSFSVDVSTYVHQIAKAAGKDIDIYVLYIGGCPINLHYKNLLSGEKAYEFYKNGERNPIMWCSIQEGLTTKVEPSSKKILTTLDFGKPSMPFE